MSERKFKRLFDELHEGGYSKYNVICSTNSRIDIEFENIIILISIERYPFFRPIYYIKDKNGIFRNYMKVIQILRHKYNTNKKILMDKYKFLPLEIVNNINSYIMNLLSKKDIIEKWCVTSKIYKNLDLLEQLRKDYVSS